MDTTVDAVEQEHVALSDLQLLVDYGRRNWWIILGSLAAALALALVYLTLRPGEYRATAVLLIQPQSTDADSREGASPTPELVRSQLEILMSQRVLGAVVNRLNLTNNAQFTSEVSSQASHSVRAAAAREALLERIEAENDGRSNTIRLTAQAPTPVMAARITNSVAEAYIDVQREQKVRVIDATRQTLSRRLADLRSETVAAEMQAEDFRSQVGLIPLSSVPEDSESYAAATPASREIIEMSKEHAALAAKRAEAQARYSVQQRAITRGQGHSTSEVLASRVVTSLRTGEAELEQRASELLARYGPEHPLVAPVQAELAVTRGNIAEEIGRIHASVASAASASSQAFQSGDAFMGQLEGERSRDLAAGTRLTQLQREAKLKRATYEEYAAQMQRAAERAGLQLPDVLLVSPALVPFRRAGPDAPLVLGIAAIAGLASGILLGILRSLMADRTIIHRQCRTIRPS